MTAPAQTIASEERRQLEELYRQQISAVRTLARLLGYPCPITTRTERRAIPVQAIDESAILGAATEQGLR
jgi:hypothetical protein